MKVEELLLDFIKDSIDFVTAYFLNTAVLFLFFYLYYGKVEIAYPLSLSFFILCIIIVMKWFKYKAFNEDIKMTEANSEYKVRYFNREQKRASDIIHKLHISYGKELLNIKLKDRDQRRLISQFLHSLKAPVTVIDIAASDLLNSSEDHCQANKQELNDIKIENEKILSTLDNLLSLLRLEEFQIDYTSQSINLKESLEGIINSLKRSFIYGRVVPKIECSCSNPIVYTDEKWNRVMLEQFISNGIKYSLAGENLKTLYFTINKDDKYVTLIIRDEGIGIPEYDLDRITEPFFTGENGRKVRKSSGIGLYIAKKISGKLNNKIDIKSEQNVGTEIKITYLSKM